MSGSRFWRDIYSRYNLVGKKCGNCGMAYYPPRSVCTQCHRLSIGKMENVKFSGMGRIVTFTRVHESSDGFEMQIPYTMAIIQLDEGARITAQIVDNEDGEVEIGKRVEVVFRKINEEGEGGVIHYGYKFKVVE